MVGTELGRARLHELLSMIVEDANRANPEDVRNVHRRLPIQGIDLAVFAAAFIGVVAGAISAMHVFGTRESG